jgi:hypothetical protein
MGMETPKIPTPEDIAKHGSNPENKSGIIEIKDPALFDLYRTADDFGRGNRSLEEIKSAAARIASELVELGVTNFPPESTPGQAYVYASKVGEEYQDAEQARSAMSNIASLIKNTGGFEESAKLWEDSKNK